MCADNSPTTLPVVSAFGLDAQANKQCEHYTHLELLLAEWEECTSFFYKSDTSCFLLARKSQMQKNIEIKKVL